MNWTLARLVPIAWIACLGTGRLSAFSAESKTVTANGGSAASSALATRLFLDAGTTAAPIGTTVWFVADKNGDGVPTSPTPGALLGADDEIVYRDIVDGDQPGGTAGRYRRLDIPVPDSLRNAVIYMYLWNGTGTGFVPVDGSTFGLFRFGIVPPPDVGNAPWLVDANVNASQHRVGGSPANRPPVFAAIPDQVATNGFELVFVVSAVDPDLGQTVRFGLGDGAPAGATIGSASGELRWTPGPSDVGVRTFRVVATDNGVPNLSSTSEVRVEVRDRPAPPIPSVTWSPGSGVGSESIRFLAVAGYHYVVQRRTSLTQGEWTDAAVPVVGSGLPVDLPLQGLVGGDPSVFLRIVAR